MAMASSTWRSHFRTGSTASCPSFRGRGMVVSVRPSRSPWGGTRARRWSDGKPDLVLVNSSDRSFSILRNTTTFDPAGGFEPATVFAAGGQPLGVAVGDFNGDGKLDLATANFLTNNVSILLGTGSDAFGPATNFSVGSDPVSVAV